MSAEMETADWRHRSACQDEDPETFFPVSVSETGPAPIAQIAQAKAVCQRCLVTDECLAWALESGQAYGIWGGTTPSERRRILRVGAPS